MSHGPASENKEYLYNTAQFIPCPPRHTPGTLQPRLRWGALGGIVVMFLALTAPCLPAATMADLGVLPGGSSSVANDINNNGQAVGSADTASGSSHAVRWDAQGIITDLGVLPGGSYSYATDINNDGQVVGYADTASGNPHAVRWDP